MKARLEAMSEATSLRVMQPIIENRAKPIQDMAKQLAPHRHGTLRAGIVLDFLKAGVGYCYFVLTLTRQAFYGVFQEYGLGMGRSSAKLATKTIKARQRYLGRRQAAAISGKRMRRRGGEPHNMAAQPFMRPAVRFNRDWFVNSVIGDLFEAIGREGASQ